MIDITERRATRPNPTIDATARVHVYTDNAGRILLNFGSVTVRLTYEQSLDVEDGLAVVHGHDAGSLQGAGLWHG